MTELVTPAVLQIKSCVFFAALYTGGIYYNISEHGRGKRNEEH